MTAFRGQTENAGHFLQPTTNAIGHMVIEFLHRSLRVQQAGREDAHEPHFGLGGAEMQTNLDHLETANEVSAGLVERASSMGPFSGRRSATVECVFVQMIAELYTLLLLLSIDGFE